MKAMDDVTLGELSRRLDLMHGDLQAINGRLVDQQDLNAVAEARRDALAAHERLAAEKFNGMDQRITRIESAMTWLTRTVVTQVFVILGSVAVVFVSR